MRSLRLTPPRSSWALRRSSPSLGLRASFVAVGWLCGGAAIGWAALHGAAAASAPFASQLIAHRALADGVSLLLGLGLLEFARRGRAVEEEPVSATGQTAEAER